MLIYLIITNCQTGNNPLLTLSSPSASPPLSPPSISWYKRLCWPTPNYTGSNSSPSSLGGYQVIWGLLLQIRKPSWTPSQAVPACRRNKASEVSPPLTLCKIVSHSWNHPQPWDNLWLYLSMNHWIHLSTTSPSTTNLPSCIPLNRILLANIS